MGVLLSLCCPVSQADLPDLVAKVGRLCNCKAGPAGAVSGYLAFGTSMDYLYVHKRVPYPLTVEVYGGDNIGELRGIVCAAIVCVEKQDCVCVGGGGTCGCIQHIQMRTMTWVPHEPYWLPEGGSGLP
jgi:hypothetical protein